MKNHYKILTAVFIFTYSFSFSQTFTTVPSNISELAKTPINYSDDIKILSLSRSDTNVVFNDKMLNVFFAKEISKNFYGTNDLTLEKFYASIDADENSLSLGTTFVFNQKSKLEPLKYIFNVGVKAKLEDKFSTIFKNGKLDNSELGITGKVSRVGNGILNYTSKDPVKLERYNSIIDYRKLVQEKYSKKIKEYIATDYKFDLDSLKAINSDLKETDKVYKDFIKEKYEGYYQSIANEEIEFIKKNKMYKSFSDLWFSADFFIPIAEKEYKHSNSESNLGYQTSNFYPIKLSGSVTLFRKWSAGQSLYLTGQAAVFNNNSFLLESANKVSFQTITNQSATQQSVSNTEIVYIGEYSKFITTAFRAELVFFPWKFVGISPAIEQNVGSYYHNTNWKLGIPFSFNDKDDKSTVNFEVQWKEQNDNHYVGISVSYVFGKFIK
ncbi:MAG: hypothetical protein H7Y10_14720 [Flavobacterium sp.]|nr:hypothetical protein [Flavobacterium sp.]